MNTMKQLKADLKGWASEIRSLKLSRKLDANGYRERQLYDIQCDIDKLKWTFRHHHIAYCLLRGRTREQIERPKNNFPSESYIEQIRVKMLEKIDAEKTLCAVA